MNHSIPFAEHVGCTNDGYHMVRLGTKHPVIYVIDYAHKIFKQDANKELIPVSEDELIQKPWIRKNIFNQIRYNARSYLAHINNTAKRHKQRCI